MRRCAGALGALGAMAVGALLFAACAPKTRPNVAPPAVWRVPTVPAELAGAAPRVRYDEAWARVQRGDVGGGERIFEEINRRTPAFYPAVASLGELRLHRQQYGAAAALFERALVANPSYLPALSGAADARLGAGDDAGALRALTALVAADPTRADAVARLDAVRVRVAQAELVLAERDKAEGQFEDAALHLQRAMEVTPENAAVFRAASALELAMGRPGVAEQRARQALAIDPQDAGAYAAVGDALEAQGRIVDAVAAYDRALGLDPRPQWRDRRNALSASAQLTALPPQYRAIAHAPTVTRADVAAMLGIQLAGALGHAPDRNSTVVTDVRGHWAASWILPVVRAGWIDALPNHTFQPGGVVHRAELAAVVAAALADVAAARPRDIARWRSARPVFADVTRDHAAYGVAAIAVASGVMSTEAGRFSPARAVSGAELIATIARLGQMQR